MSPNLGPYAFLPDLVAYVIDSDDAIVAAAQKIPERDYYRDQEISKGSLHRLLVHAMGAQWVWLQRFLGASLLRIPDHIDFPTRDALAARWPEVHNALRDFMNIQTLDTLHARLTYTTLQGKSVTAPLGQLLMHVTDHASYHRGQQNTLLKLAGVKEAPTYLPYYQWSLAHNVDAPSD
jgi:uncharacterized damage-inducible protein DinB